METVMRKYLAGKHKTRSERSDPCLTNRSDSSTSFRIVGTLSDNRSMQEPITRDPEVMHGTPVFRGTRVPVKTMFEYLENGDSLDDFLQGFPTVSRELAVQVLEESRELRLARVS